jgi:hypothetical protein
VDGRRRGLSVTDSSGGWRMEAGGGEAARTPQLGRNRPFRR